MKKNKRLTIAIDGYSSCGKSTLAKALAQMLGYVFIDTGAMYRGVTLYCLQNDLIDHENPDHDEIIKRLDDIQLEFHYNPESEKSDLYLNGIDVEPLIRRPEVAAMVSKVATIKEVREKLVSEQRKMGSKGGIVMDGRDIGSVVFPKAELKLFITAEPKIRAHRRLKELHQRGIHSTLDEVLQNLTERDFIDSTRKESPLTQTKDAIVIDTSNLTPEDQLNLALQYVQETLLSVY